VSRPSIEDIYDFSNDREKDSFLTEAGTLEGLYRVEIEPTNGGHRDPQRRYFHAVVVKALRQYLNNHEHGDGTRYTPEQCKDFIVAKVFGTKDLIHPLTGEVVQSGATRPSTRDFSVEQYSALIDGGRAWLRKTFGIRTPDPDPEWRTKREVAHA
jgi:hypothetical protein